MSDGREEREEWERRIEQEKREDREDRINRDEPDEWKPERVDSDVAETVLSRATAGPELQMRCLSRSPLLWR